MQDKPVVALISLGCDKNLVESERMLFAIGGACVFCAEPEGADLIVINTCGFIRDATEEAREHIADALALKAGGCCRAVIVTGCAANRYSDELSADFPNIDKILTDTADLPAAIADIFNIDIPRQEGRILATPGHYAYLKIAEGCDNACAYCAIPMIKGPYKSQPMDTLLAEAEALAAGGVKELIIVAQDTAVYGADLYGEVRLVPLLRALSGIDAIRWIRLMYCYPEHIGDDLINEMSTNPKICKYLDMPIQHSGGDVLARMGRRMDEDALRALIARLRAAMPDIALRTTVMTGFPGETKAEFQGLLTFLDDMRFDRLGAFAYSREEGTAAYDMPDQLPERTKAARRDRLMTRQRDISEHNLRRFAGRRMSVLVEAWDGAFYVGRSEMDCPDMDGVVYIRANENALQIGDFADVIITDTHDYDLSAKPAGENE